MTEPHMLARASDPDTSHDAAAIAALSPNSREIKSAILRLLRSDGPATAFELRDLYFANRVNEGWPDCQPNTINRRVSDLANMGFVVDTGERRKTPDRRLAIVWRALTRTERNKLMANYGLGTFKIDVETDWSKVSDVRRLRQRIADLEARDPLTLARNIVNQLADLYVEEMPDPRWVDVRQRTNDRADAFVARLIRKGS